MKGCESAKDFYTRGDCDNYCGRRKVSSGVDVYSDREHMVGSDDEAQKANGHYGSHHTHVAERLFLAGIVCNDM